MTVQAFIGGAFGGVHVNAGGKRFINGRLARVIGGGPGDPDKIERGIPLFSVIPNFGRDVGAVASTFDNG